MKDICYATQNRQTAVRLLADQCDVVLVIGADYARTRTGCERISEEAGTDSYLIPDAGSLDSAWLDGGADGGNHGRGVGP